MTNSDSTPTRTATLWRGVATMILCAAIFTRAPASLHAQPETSQPETAQQENVQQAGIAPLSDDELTRQINAYIGPRVADEQFSGVVLVAKEGEPIYQRAFGLASIAYQAPNRLDTKFNLGSMNKMFTAVAIAQLAEAGLLTFDDTISTHLPDYPNQDAAAHVTIHHLLTHTSGLADYFNEMFVAANPARFRTVESFLPLFAEEPLQFEPGSTWSYSNSNFIVLGAIIEAVTGQDYESYVQAHIYAPAGMTNTAAYEMDRETPNLATGYTRAPVAGDASELAPHEWRNNHFLHVIKGGPAGGGYSTAADLLAFAQALLDNQLLSEEMTALVTAPHIAAPGQFDAHYGYGFMHETLNGVHRFGHSGGFEGISTELNIYPELGYVVVILANIDPPAAPFVSLRIGKLLTGMEIPVAIKLPAAQVRAYGQVYTFAGEGGAPPELEFRAEDGALILVGGTPHRFLPLSETEFFDEEFEDVRVTFAVDDAGEVTGFTIVGLAPMPLEYVASSE